MDDAKQKLVDKLKTANNILVTVSRDPSVDQLASCLGLGLLLNKQGKHAAAVFSGQIPSTIEFLKPEDTLEKNTDSLRDFIIALDKSKADKLRYKVEDNIVRIFITPYRTSISVNDLDFSEGDFNVDVVIALGVSRQEDLDEAITAHGRILHDATVASINLTTQEGLGSIVWQDPNASSLSEIVTNLAFSIDSALVDSQIATALLTGIVSATDRFRNDKTTPETMSASSKLMSAGANQQLVASELEVHPSNDSGVALPKVSDDKVPADQTADGMLHIEHNDDGVKSASPQQPIDLPEPQDNRPAPPSQAKQDEMPLFLETPRTATAPDNVSANQTEDNGPNDNFAQAPKMMDGPPSFGGALTANTPSENPVNEPPQILERKPLPESELTPPPAGWTPPPSPQPSNLPPVPPSYSTPLSPPPPPSSPLPPPGTSLSDIEAATKAAEQREAGMVNTARDEVSKALSSSNELTVEPIQALNALPLGDSLHPTLNELLSSEKTEHIAEPIPQPSQEISPTNASPAMPLPPPVPPPLPIQLNNPNLPQ